MKIYIIAFFLLFIGCDSSGQKKMVQIDNRSKLQIDSLKDDYQRVNKSDTKENEKKYIANFPNDFSQFQETFGYDDKLGKGKPLYNESYDYIKMFFQCLKNNPKFIKKALDISINAKWDVDAENFFQMELETMISKNPSLICEQLNNYSDEQQKSIWHFIANGVKKKTEIPQYLFKIKNCNPKAYSIAIANFSSQRLRDYDSQNLNLDSLLKELADNSYKLIFEKKCDLNGDGLQDIILVVSIKKEFTQNDIITLDSPIYVLLNNGDKTYKSLRNRDLIYTFMPNTPAEGFKDVVVKNNYFTIEQQEGAGWLFIDTYTTFKYDITKKEIILSKYGRSFTDRRDPDKSIRDEIYTSKDFKTINFENANSDDLKKLNH
ncbi:hypothetical protein NG800_002210 [Epilithonimonas ginsengisoli]|uniref:Lipoprotein n=1 Tax=Epilithonimonas ginsengisoli TaxID=1245592 RepID=A0ABU4JDF6_9FLAO|nr:MULTISPECIES: hypothetical protein [Chryseobacterium group]MBV6878680.1 hypothetical protein [Epilithonimonas sp. FP105]MDW8547706.1 hypothetical protein [Epilithonimonas ginsengisoli]OAH75930.1 hypothetical protein AXA65_02305 [Chryseobacterium sp. FP211-J200]